MCMRWAVLHRLLCCSLLGIFTLITATIKVKLSVFCLRLLISLCYSFLEFFSVGGQFWFQPFVKRRQADQEIGTQVCWITCFVEELFVLHQESIDTRSFCGIFFEARVDECSKFRAPATGLRKSRR